ncbi:hypothetical protein Tco_1019111 [Tanacetum coccineum]|uniref:Uncharacterized protein n=1 Tax=Tanacetum coccineum TaxID=301880 RepID=A0ABQ5FW97_9ASTR
MKSIQTFLKKFIRISFRETPKVLSLAWEKVFEIQHAFREKQHQPEDIQELLHKLLKDLQIISEELAEYISPIWNCHAFYDNDDEYTIQYKEYLDNSSNAITHDLPTEEPDNSLSMGDEHLSTILETESDEVIKSSVEDLVPILSESEGISDDTCDVPFCDNSPPLDVLNDHFEIFSDFNDDCTSSVDDSFEDIDYVEASPPDTELVSLEEVKDDILHEKLLNINLLISKIESLNDNPTPDYVLKSPLPFPIPVEDSDSFFEKFDTSLSYSDNSLPEFETFSDIHKRRGELTNVVIEEVDTFLVLEDSIPPGIESNFDPGGEPRGSQSRIQGSDSKKRRVSVHVVCAWSCLICFMESMDLIHLLEVGSWLYGVYEEAAGVIDIVEFHRCVFLSYLLAGGNLFVLKWCDEDLSKSSKVSHIDEDFVKRLQSTYILVLNEWEIIILEIIYAPQGVHILELEMELCIHMLVETKVSNYKRAYAKNVRAKLEVQKENGELLSNVIRFVVEAKGGFG